MQAGELYRSLRTQLGGAGIEDAGYEARLLLEAAGLDRFSSNEVDEACRARLEGLAQRRCAREPLQYLLGRWAFMGLELAVGPGVLIPRADTECVCERALAAIEGVEAPRVLDLCAGSGALALGIAAHHAGARVTAVELEDAALGWLRRNVATHDEALGGRVAAIQADAFTFWRRLEAGSLDLIVSNPPYVTGEEYAALEPELYHEPRTALVAEDDGLAFYKGIAAGYKDKLRTGGAIVFEIGSGQAGAVCGILAREGYTGIESGLDYGGNPRWAKALKP